MQALRKYPRRLWTGAGVALVGLGILPVGWYLTVVDAAPWSHLLAAIGLLYLLCVGLAVAIERAENAPAGPPILRISRLRLALYTAASSITLVTVTTVGALVALGVAPDELDRGPFVPAIVAPVVVAAAYWLVPLVVRLVDRTVDREPPE
jgi:hypothetical protein